MIIPNPHNGYQPDNTRRYCKGKGKGSNKAVKLEQQRIAKMNATIGNYFNDMAQLYLANKLAGTANTTPLSQLYNPYGAYNLGTNDTYGGSNS